MRTIVFLSIVLLCQFLNGQTTDKDSVAAIEKPKWIQKNRVSLDISEVTFVNWSSGGSNSISGLLGLNSSLNYDRQNFFWKNSGKIRYGVNKQEAQNLRKTEDILEIDSKMGYRKDSLTNWFFSGHVNLKSQFTNGYNYPNKETPISKFMAPGYMFIGAGAEYGKDFEKFSFYFSPLTVKTTFVLDEALANKGAFGVDPAVYDADGNLIRSGQRIRNEVGILVSHFFETEMFENIKISTKLNLYTDYLENFGNVDVDWLVAFDFKVNQFVRASLSSHLKYDDDIKISTPTGIDGEYVERGAKVQWKQLLGIGVAFNF
ncbi:DUF3078 domain-containing protein [Gelidibacter sp.]|uniref:DUF3078 domain-containing protein n=1 Tax=Gelidibacter sp. TaxID=2018083 RepID=UPI002B9310EE|nr:DUF3078 domain-containing protein [Gelidibacter sp.]HUH27757.1 DUF3078 domain-containing protein [Gelidibacter sp.]